MNADQAKDYLHSFAVGLVIVVIFIGIGWPLILFSWAAQ